MLEEQGFKSLKFYNKNNKEIVFPDIYSAGVDHQQQIEQSEENKDDQYEYNNNNVEDIYYDEIDQEELDRLLEDTEINPNFHQDKYKDIYEDADKENDTQDMYMDHPEEDIILYDDEDKDDDVINE